MAGKFIIKVTYLEGRSAGRVYFMIKGGYVTDCPESVHEDNTYTKKACKMVCAKYTKSNDKNVMCETQDRERNERNGKTNSEYRIYNPCKYEPYEVGKPEEPAAEPEVTEVTEEPAAEPEVTGNAPKGKYRKLRICKGYVENHEYRDYWCVEALRSKDLVWEVVFKTNDGADYAYCHCRDYVMRHPEMDF